MKCSSIELESMTSEKETKRLRRPGKFEVVRTEPAVGDSVRAYSDKRVGNLTQERKSWRGVRVLTDVRKRFIAQALPESLTTAL